METQRKNLKISSTPYRALMILYLLNRGNYTLDELIDCLSADNIVSRTFSKDVILKYISTIRLSGFKVTKTPGPNPTYHLDKSPFSMEFNEEDIKNLAIVNNYVKNLYQPNLIATFNDFMNKLQRYLDEENLKKLDQYKKATAKKVQSNYKHYAHLIRQLEESCLDNYSIQVTYMPLDGLVQTIVLEPEKIEYKNQTVYICGNNPKISQTQYLQLDYIKNIKKLPSKIRQIKCDCQVTYKLTGRVAKSYRLYEGERITREEFYPQSIHVSLSVNDLDALLHRLLRYGDYCEVISPEPARQKMKLLITNLLQTYSDIA
jgi:predicted DNA-binding transcriptional regulator YafY